MVLSWRLTMRNPITVSPGRKPSSNRRWAIWPPYTAFAKISSPLLLLRGRNRDGAERGDPISGGGRSPSMEGRDSQPKNAKNVFRPLRRIVYALDKVASSHSDLGGLAMGQVQECAMKRQSDNHLMAPEITKRERDVLHHMLTTPHKPHKPLGKTTQAKRRKKEKRTK